MLLEQFSLLLSTGNARQDLIDDLDFCHGQKIDPLLDPLSLTQTQQIIFGAGFLMSFLLDDKQGAKKIENHNNIVNIIVFLSIFEYAHLTQHRNAIVKTLLSQFHYSNSIIDALGKFCSSKSIGFSNEQLQDLHQLLIEHHCTHCSSAIIFQKEMLSRKVGNAQPNEPDSKNGVNKI